MIVRPSPKSITRTTGFSGSHYADKEGVWSINQLGLWFRLIRFPGQMRHPTLVSPCQVVSIRDGSEFTQPAQARKW